MATFTATAAQAAAPAFYNINGAVTRIVQFSQTASFSAGDVIQMVRIPIGAIVSEVGFACSFSAGAATVNVGDGNDVSAYAAAVVLSGSVVSVSAIPYRGIGRSYSAEDTIDIHITAVSTPPADAKLTLRVTYTNGNGN